MRHQIGSGKLTAASGRSARGRPRSAASSDAILASTRELLVEVGYERLTIEGVAARSGTGKATIYRWWSTKGELVLDAAGEEIAIGVVPDTGETRADLQAAIGQLIGTFSRPFASIVIFAAITTATADPKMAQIFRDKYVYPWRKSAAEALVRGVARGDLNDEDIQFVLDVIVGTVFQRTLVLKELNTEGLTGQLIGLLLR
jgi:AcrR family transcriptional regulator